MSIEPTCPKCHLVNIIFDFHKLPLDCQFCGAGLVKKKIINVFNKGHKIIDAEKLNTFLKDILPKNRLNKFERNFIAYKIAQNENRILKEEKK